MDAEVQKCKSNCHKCSQLSEIHLNPCLSSISVGTKYQSNLNEIGKSEQKLTGENPKGYDWSKDKSAAARMQLWLPHACCNSNKLTYTPRICCNYAMLIALVGMLLTIWLQTAMIKTTTTKMTATTKAAVATTMDVASATAADSATNMKAVSASTTATASTKTTATATATVVLSAADCKTIRKEFTTNERALMHTPLHMHNETRSISIAYKQA